MAIELSKKVKTFLKVVISLSLITFVIYRAGPYKIWEEIVKINKFYFLIVIGITIIKVAISAKKWQILLRAKEEVKGFLYVWKVYYIGTFFNMFLPTNVGGDVVKAHKMSKVSKRAVEAYSSVFMERFTGIAAILSLALVSTTLYFDRLPLEIVVVVYLVFLPLMLLTTLLIWKKSLGHKLIAISDRLFRNFNPFSIRQKIRKLYRSVNLYRKKKRALSEALMISFVFHTLLILSNYILALSIGMEVNLFYFFIFIPITAILLFLPISIKGFGVREVLYIYFFTQVGASTAQAVSLSFLVQLIGLISSLIGGVVYVSLKGKEL
ncbi:MAG: lysylphosphatidylglycerol synthase transmembrane domain-containing protein [Thermoplasmatota archaeon]